MREKFHDSLDRIFVDLAAICRLVETAVGQASEALMTGDAGVAEHVISADVHIDLAREAVEESCFELLSLQQPVAKDLRTVVAALRMVAELERMGDLAVHVAKIARLRVPEVAVPGVGVGVEVICPLVLGMVLGGMSGSAAGMVVNSSTEVPLPASCGSSLVKTAVKVSPSAEMVA